MISGTALPRDCDTPPAHLARVQVRIGGGRWFTARGTGRWTLTLARRLPRGRYAVHARVTDATANSASATPRMLAVKSS